jgi:hypothetical protein
MSVPHYILPCSCYILPILVQMSCVNVMHKYNICLSSDKIQLCNMSECFPFKFKHRTLVHLVFFYWSEPVCGPQYFRISYSSLFTICIFQIYECMYFYIIFALLHYTPVTFTVQIISAVISELLVRQVRRRPTH